MLLPARRLQSPVENAFRGGDETAFERNGSPQVVRHGRGSLRIIVVKHTDSEGLGKEATFEVLTIDGGINLFPEGGGQSTPLAILRGVVGRWN